MNINHKITKYTVPFFFELLFMYFLGANLGVEFEKDRVFGFYNGSVTMCMAFLCFIISIILKERAAIADKKATEQKFDNFLNEENHANGK